MQFNLSHLADINLLNRVGISADTTDLSSINTSVFSPLRIHTGVKYQFQHLKCSYSSTQAHLTAAELAACCLKGLPQTATVETNLQLQNYIFTQSILSTLNTLIKLLAQV